MRLSISAQTSGVNQRRFSFRVAVSGTTLLSRQATMDPTGKTAKA
jgi:hypothetical protein